MSSASIPDHYLYTIDDLSTSAFTAYKYLSNSGNIKIIKQMLGFSSEGIRPNTSEDMKDVSLQRIQRIYVFWNQTNNDFLSVIVSIFSTRTDISTLSIADVHNKNAFVTYLLVLFFKGILSSPDSINPANPLDMFTSPADKKDFSFAIVNLIKFVGTINGLGNYPVFNGTDSVSNIKAYWNKGFIFQYCQEQYIKSCNNSSGFKNSTSLDLNDPTKEQDCVQNYRKKLSDTPLALSWCGCFSPIPTFVKNAMSDASKRQGAGEVFIPSVCDNLCYKQSVTEVINTGGEITTGVIPYYHPPIGSSGPTVNNSNEAGTPIKCLGATICVIDQNNISSENTTGDINFNQICQCKPGNPCLCYIDTSTPGVLDNVSNGEKGMLNQTNFSQKCTNAICYKIDGKGNYQEVKCNGINTASTGDVFGKNKDGLSEIKNYEKIYDNFWYSLIFLTFVFVVFIFSYFEISRKLN